MNTRRDFLKKASFGMAALELPSFRASFAGKKDSHTMKNELGTVLLLTVLFSSLLPAQAVVVKEYEDKLLLWMEAEAGNINAPMMVHDTEDASGGQFIEVRSGNNSSENAPIIDFSTRAFAHVPVGIKWLCYSVSEACQTISLIQPREPAL